jgi:hypothetical protein|nr:MAG TPA: tail sheath protein [Caudoviricetes sp.]
MGMPSISIAFKEKAVTAITRSQRGIIACIIEDENYAAFLDNPYIMYDINDLPDGLSVKNQKQVELMFKGYQTAPSKILMFVSEPVAGTTQTTPAKATVSAPEGVDKGTVSIHEDSLYTGIVGKSIVITITTAGEAGTAKFKWKVNDEKNSEEISTGENIKLIDGVAVDFSGNFTANDVYTISCVPETVTLNPYKEILDKLEHERFDYLVIPAIEDDDKSVIATWIKSMRSVSDKMIKAVLPNIAADSEGIVNFTNTMIKTSESEETFTTKDYCSRIAGIICGTPMTISCTYAPLAEVIDCDKYSKEEMDNKVNAGELFIFTNSKQFRISRGVNSFITTVQDKGESFKKIKKVDAMDMIHDDIRDTIDESYIGKYSNSYNNKCLLITAINGYFYGLANDGILNPDYDNRADFNITKIKEYLMSRGYYTKEELSQMKDVEIAKLDTDDKVFLLANIKILDAMEDVSLEINI